ncbi:MAG: hypothetical protein HY314_16990 [Acidobacteria bacterium]|nr:hypothetical protein [Acidobacteriota bacterium]
MGKLSLLSRIALTLFVLVLLAIMPVRSASVEERARGVELVGQTGLGPGAAAGDIWVHGQFAYLGTDSCGTGVKVVDVSNPATPQLVGTLLSSTASTYEDVVVISANAPAFQGDLLAVSLQVCGQRGAHDVEFWNVTDPRQPQRLGFFDTGARTGGVHELYMFQRDNRIFTLLAVPGSEGAGAGGDFRIVEATDPRNPIQIAHWRVQAGLGLDITGGGVFCHGFPAHLRPIRSNAAPTDQHVCDGTGATMPPAGQRLVYDSQSPRGWRHGVSLLVLRWCACAGYF